MTTLLELVLLRVEQVILHLNEHHQETEIEVVDCFKKELIQLLSFHHVELMKLLIVLRTGEMYLNGAEAAFEMNLPVRAKN